METHANIKHTFFKILEITHALLWSTKGRESSESTQVRQCPWLVKTTGLQKKHTRFLLQKRRVKLCLHMEQSLRVERRRCISKTWTCSSRFSCWKTPAVLSLGRLCVENGHTYEWNPGESSYQESKKGKRMKCQVGNHGPLVVPGVLSTKSGLERTASGNSCWSYQSAQKHSQKE